MKLLIELSQIVTGMCQVSRQSNGKQILFQGDIASCEAFAYGQGLTVEYTPDTRPLSREEKATLRGQVASAIASASALLASIPRAEIAPEWRGHVNKPA